MNKLLLALVAILIGIPTALLRGMVIVDYARWFLHITISPIQAIGISLLFAFFIIHIAARVEVDPEIKAMKGGSKVGYNFLFSILTSLTFWLFGYLWHLADIYYG